MHGSAGDYGPAAAVPAQPAEAAAGQARRYLAFRLGGERFGIDILRIKEIIEFPGLTEVPLMPPCVRGVINLRGAVVPVVDLAARFGREPTAVARRTCIVIVESKALGEQQEVGVMADAVEAVLEIPAADIVPPPAFGTGIRVEFIAGMASIDARFVILLDVDNALMLQQAPPAGSPPPAGTAPERAA
ncbi:MAG TPA: chemotaxis protein CheW [Steroidobacteraceae bacterium]|nr:chemotaxis protein CheW [Steroidobacteraceae bacterium]